jgi:hypothetical protein
MDTREIAFRQIHLDFHTAPQTPDVGAGFNAKEYVETLKAARVNSITTFSRCHHGMIYHDTQFSARHPNLKCNLLAEQLEACHSAGIRVPIYISIGLDMDQYYLDTGLAQIEPDGKTIRGAGSQEPGWVILCFNSRYMDYCIAQTMEVLDKFQTDGLFFDIIHHNCCCQRCVDLMKRKGLDPKNETDRYLFNIETVDRFRTRMTQAIRSKNKDCTIFYNSGHVDYHIRPTLDLYTHLELESLPSGGWGYDHFPITGRYARRLGKPWLMMTGRFHTTWGDFGSFKHPEALEYECLRTISMGGACSVGDQLHPSAKLEPATYQIIGQSFEQVEKVEKVIQNTQAAAEIGILWSESTLPHQTDRGTGLTNSDRGAFRICLEEHLFADFIDLEMDLSQYRVIFLPDKVRLNPQAAAKLNAYLANGGKIICSAESGMKLDSNEFALPIPLKVAGPAKYCPEFIAAKKILSHRLPQAPIVMYLKGWDVQPEKNCEVLADAYRPYFNREANLFCSHQHWPVQGPAGRPAAVRAGNVVYFAYPVFEAYGKFASRHYKQMVANALQLLMPDRILKSNLPSTAQVDLLTGADRQVFTILHYVPENRSTNIPTIEEALPLVDIQLDLATSGTVKDVKILLGKAENFTWVPTGNKVHMAFGKIYGKIMLELKS